MKRLRLDQYLVHKKLAASRSQAEHYIKLGYVSLNGKTVTKPGQPVNKDENLILSLKEQYVSRAALKLASVADKLGLNFKEQVVLDVGSSTGGFSDFALKNGARKVIAVDVGSNQMHPSLRANPKVELYEKTDFRQFHNPAKIKFDVILVDVSFISLRDILPKVVELAGRETQIIAMAKPQFEAGKNQTNKGVVKNDAFRRKILQDFELWVKKSFVIEAKADSGVAGSKGNLERFYLLKNKG